MADDRTRYLARQTGRIILAAVDRDHYTVAHTIEEIGVEYGHDGVFQLCYALSGAVHQLVFSQIERGDGSLTGEMVAVQANKAPASLSGAASLWAARFVAAYINGDGGTASALFYGGLVDQDQTMANVATLVALAGDIARLKEQEHRDGDTGSTPKKEN